MIATKPFGATGHDSSRVIFGARRALGDTAARGRRRTAAAAGARDQPHRHRCELRRRRAAAGALDARAPSRFFLATKTEERSYARGARADSPLAGAARGRPGRPHPAPLPRAPGRMGRGDGRGRGPARRGRGARRGTRPLHRRHRPRAHDRRDAPAQPRAVRVRLGVAALQPRRMQDEPYASDFGRVLATCNERNVAVQTIKGIARGPWGSKEHTSSTWYEPLVDQARDRPRRALGARRALGVPQQRRRPGAAAPRARCRGALQLTPGRGGDGSAPRGAAAQHALRLTRRFRRRSRRWRSRRRPSRRTCRWRSRRRRGAGRR